MAKKTEADYRYFIKQITSILQQQSWPQEDFDELALQLRRLMNKTAISMLIRALKSVGPQEITKAELRKIEKLWLDAWLRAHPGKTVKDYQRMSADERQAWREAHNARQHAAEQRAYERDHSGKKMPEENCGMSFKEFDALRRWRKARRARR